MSKTKITIEPGKQEMTIEREFDAPRELVFKAHTDPELYKQWVGPHGLEMIIEQFEAKDNGNYKFIHKDKDGNEYRFHGVFHEITSPERIIQTFEYDGLPEKGHVSLEIAIFEDLGNGRSKITSKSVFMSQSDRDGMIESGMEQGITEGYERLDEILKTTK